MRVAIVHDWLYTYAGAERVLEQIINCFPDADLYSLIDFIPDSARGFLKNKPVRTSFIQKLPWVRTRHRHYLPLMPLAIEQFDLSAYDVIISSSHAVAKGVLTGPDQLHICYCHSPIRYAWDLQHEYLREAGLTHGVKSWLTRYLLHKIRLWDYRTANGVDYFIANSQFIARRIHKVYRREATVIHPPVATHKFTPVYTKGDFYFTASRLVPYKQVALIAEAFAQMPQRKLIIAGSGPDEAKVQKIVERAPNIQFLGYIDDATMINYLQTARAFVFAALEDFGIMPLEAQACATPVIAYGNGGVCDSLYGLDADTSTAVFFKQQTTQALINAIDEFEATTKIDLKHCELNAQRFSNENFCRQFTDFVVEKYQEFKAGH